MGNENGKRKMETVVSNSRSGLLKSCTYKLFYQAKRVKKEVTCKMEMSSVFLRKVSCIKKKVSLAIKIWLIR